MYMHGTFVCIIIISVGVTVVTVDIGVIISEHCRHDFINSTCMSSVLCGVHVAKLSPSLLDCTRVCLFKLDNLCNALVSATRTSPFVRYTCRSVPYFLTLRTYNVA